MWLITINITINDNKQWYKTLIFGIIFKDEIFKNYYDYDCNCGCSCYCYYKYSTIKNTKPENRLKINNTMNRSYLENDEDQNWQGGSNNELNDVYNELCRPIGDERYSRHAQLTTTLQLNQPTSTSAYLSSRWYKCFYCIVLLCTVWPVT